MKPIVKKAVFVAVSLSLLSAPVLGQGLDKGEFEAQVFNIQAGQPLQLAELSEQEMRETEGEFLPVMGYGAYIGGLALIGYFLYEDGKESIDKHKKDLDDNIEPHFGWDKE